LRCCPKEKNRDKADRLELSIERNCFPEVEKRKYDIASDDAHNLDCGALIEGNAKYPAVLRFGRTSQLNLHPGTQNPAAQVASEHPGGRRP
jgi:hypothetical protein